MRDQVSHLFEAKEEVIFLYTGWRKIYLTLDV